MKRFCLALDLKDDPAKISAYEQWHLPGNVWPGVIKSIRASGITDMQIYRTGNRLFMVIDTTDSFRLEDKAAMDLANPVVQDWEHQMADFQQALPWADSGEKWISMNMVFQLPGC